MKELTKAEEQIMQILWKIKKGFVHDILEYFPEPKPAYNTVSTIVRILEKKNFVGHNAYGKSHEYYPLMSKKDYTKSFFRYFMKDYFSNSPKEFASFFAKNEKLGVKDLEDILNIMNGQIDEKKSKKK